jgi:hypothetical protein
MKLPINYNDANQVTRKKAREQYVEDQGKNCYHCRCSLEKKAPKKITDKKINWHLFPPFFLRYPIHLHHDHKTEMTIGAVHAYCNAVLWQYYGE